MRLGDQWRAVLNGVVRLANQLRDVLDRVMYFGYQWLAVLDSVMRLLGSVAGCSEQTNVF